MQNSLATVVPFDKHMEPGCRAGSWKFTWVKKLNQANPDWVNCPQGLGLGGREGGGRVCVHRDGEGGSALRRGAGLVRELH